MNHTPGPWFTDEKQDTDERRYVMSEKAPFPGTVAVVTLDVPEAEANARLIAAAPDLLEALQFIATNRYAHTDDMRKVALAAIAKAIGEST